MLVNKYVNYFFLGLGAISLISFLTIGMTTLASFFLI